jgi:hypothetical protein
MSAGRDGRVQRKGLIVSAFADYRNADWILSGASDLAVIDVMPGNGDGVVHRGDEPPLGPAKGVNNVITRATETGETRSPRNRRELAHVQPFPSYAETYRNRGPALLIPRS